MVYNDYIKELSEHFEYLIKKISSNHNFEIEEEFEIALCKAFRKILPSKYGICRGYMYSANGQSDGGSIIIYDQQRFPTLRILEDNRSDDKQYIPIEAVYAYIEAIHTVCIDETDKEKHLNKALKKISDVKSIPRKAVTMNQIDPYITLSGANVTRTNWPNIQNPLYGAVWIYNVKIDQNSKTNLEPKEIFNNLIFKKSLIASADLLIIGDCCIGIPAVKDDSGQHVYISPFLLSQSNLGIFIVPNTSFSLGILSLLYALDTIRLGMMPWYEMIQDGIYPKQFEITIDSISHLTDKNDIDKLNSLIGEKFSKEEIINKLNKININEKEISKIMTFSKHYF